MFGLDSSWFVDLVVVAMLIFMINLGIIGIMDRDPPTPPAV